MCPRSLNSQSSVIFTCFCYTGPVKHKFYFWGNELPMPSWQPATCHVLFYFGPLTMSFLFLILVLPRVPSQFRYSSETPCQTTLTKIIHPCLSQNTVTSLKLSFLFIFLFNHCLSFPLQDKFHKAETIIIFFTTPCGIESAMAETKINEPSFYPPGKNDLMGEATACINKRLKGIIE